MPSNKSADALYEGMAARMAIPDYQPLKLPVLKLASDGNEQILSSAIEELKDEFWIDADPSNLTLLIKSI